MNPNCTVSWNFLGYLSSLCPNFVVAVGGDPAQQLSVWFPPFPDILFHGQGTELCLMAVCIWYKTATTDFLLSSRVKMSNYSLSTGRKREGKRNHFSLQSFSM